MTDTEIGRDVQAELAYEPSLNHAKIDVSLSEGIATLTGVVQSYPMFIGAERAALRVPGVRAVVNELEVELPPERVRTDEALATIASEILQWTVQVPAEHIKLGVDDGRITLFGEVNQPFEKESAEHAVQNLIGVRKVINEIRVAVKRHGNGNSEHLTAALHRSAISHACDVHVEMRGDYVRLSGSVPTWADRDEVVRIAWAAPGIRHVDCHLRVTPPPRHKAHRAEAS